MPCIALQDNIFYNAKDDSIEKEEEEHRATWKIIGDILLKIIILAAVLFASVGLNLLLFLALIVAMFGGLNATLGLLFLLGILGVSNLMSILNKKLFYKLIGVRFLKSITMPWLFFVGSYDNPLNNLKFPLLAANHGYHLVSLKYPNSVAAITACASSKDPNCYLNLPKRNYRGRGLQQLSDEILIKGLSSLQQINKMLK